MGKVKNKKKINERPMLLGLLKYVDALVTLDVKYLPLATYKGRFRTLWARNATKCNDHLSYYECEYFHFELKI